jgi:hypothetical protein
VEIIIIFLAWILSAICHEMNMTMGFWWGYQFGILIPAIVAILYIRPSRFGKLDGTTFQAEEVSLKTSL